MIGFEILGIILGIVPIVTASIEQYKASLAMREVRQLERSFKTQRNIFLNTIEELLSSLVSDAQLKELLDHPDGEAWRDVHIATKLEEHLGESYQSFTEILEDVRGMMLELEKILNSDDLKRRHLLKPIKQFLSRARGEAGLNRLSARIAELETLQAQSLRLAPTRQFKGGMEAFGKVRECALNLHEALSRGWHCDCKTPHLANLRLEARRSPQAKAGKASDDEFRFKFLFSFAADENKGGQPLDWREAELARLEDENQTVPEAPKGLGGSAGPTLQPSQQSKASTTRAPENKSVSFELSNSQAPSSSSSSSSHKQGNRREIVGNHNTEIKDLCRWIKNIQTTRPDDGKCLGYLSDAKETRYGLFSVNPRSDVEPPMASIHVGEPLSPSRRRSRTGRAWKRQSFSQGVKHQLASTLGSTVLQLHSTPWLEGWDKQDIQYLPEAEGDTAQSPTSPVQPYISRRFSSSKSRTSSVSSSTTAAQVQGFARNETLFTLGVVLIEIAYNKPIEDLVEPGDLARTAAMTRHFTALRLHKQIQLEMGKQYQRAVVGCLFCDFGAECSDADLKVPQFQRKVLEHVVLPLEEAMKPFYTVSTAD
ncbi:hypothetical protein OEA41_010232 [Lepraria neglecta]|uniref:DUF7580 domain-containing protein n=1 Tax=Lepraria neglecta TaxID=209136 RepID=A0AAD9YZE8_9LECA|nr:hypothetical protein OEA41_010232 [Lepraria neglecta]